ncbi:hypothetical protein M0804_003097 [Polistes exclamans]|nr:hypothetical protein M0804_003097 [Polistes exclamans]
MELVSVALSNTLTLSSRTRYSTTIAKPPIVFQNQVGGGCWCRGVGQYKCTEVPTAAERTWKSCDQIKIKAEDGISTYEAVNLIYEQVTKAYKDTEINWNLIHDAGCTIDDTELPHHVTAPHDLQRLINITFTNFLEAIPGEPTIVTISRSVEDDYCPLEDIDTIQVSVLNQLVKHIKSPVDIQENYEKICICRASFRKEGVFDLWLDLHKIGATVPLWEPSTMPIGLGGWIREVRRVSIARGIGGCAIEVEKLVVEEMVHSYQHNVDTPWLFCELRARTMAPRVVEEGRNEIEMELPEVADGPAAFQT